MKTKPMVMFALVLSLVGGSVQAEGEVVEKSDVLVPDGIFGTMRRVDSETLILPNAGAVLRNEEQRTIAREAHEQSEARVRAVRPVAVEPTPTPRAALGPEGQLLEESVGAMGVVPPPLGLEAPMADLVVDEEIPEAPEAGEGITEEVVAGEDVAEETAEPEPAE